MINRNLEVLEGSSISVKETEEHKFKVKVLENQAKLLQMELSRTFEKKTNLAMNSSSFLLSQKKKLSLKDLFHIFKNRNQKETMIKLDTLETLQTDFERKMETHFNILKRMYAYRKVETNSALEFA
jgi:hypothetical protein